MYPDEFHSNWFQMEMPDGKCFFWMNPDKRGKKCLDQITLIICMQAGIYVKDYEETKSYFPVYADTHQ